MNSIWRGAKQISKEKQGESYYPDEHIPAQGADANRHQELMIRSYDLDYVFHDDEPVERQSPYSTVYAPIYKGRENLNVTRDSNPVMVGSGPVPSGPEPTRLINPQDPYSHNTPSWRIAATDVGVGIRSRSPTRIRGTVMGGTGSVLSEPGPHRLNTPHIPLPD